MIVSAKIEGLSRVRKRLEKLRALPNLDAVLREGAELVRDEARTGLSKTDVSDTKAAEIAASLEVRPTPDKNGYAIESTHDEGADFEFGTLEKPETRWLGGAIDAKRRQIGDLVRNYLRDLVK